MLTLPRPSFSTNPGQGSLGANRLLYLLFLFSCSLSSTGKKQLTPGHSEALKLIKFHSDWPRSGSGPEHLQSARFTLHQTCRLPICKSNLMARYDPRLLGVHVHACLHVCQGVNGTLYQELHHQYQASYACHLILANPVATWVPDQSDAEFQYSPC